MDCISFTIAIEAWRKLPENVRFAIRNESIVFAETLAIVYVGFTATPSNWRAVCFGAKGGQS